MLISWELLVKVTELLKNKLKIRCPYNRDVFRTPQGLNMLHKT